MPVGIRYATKQTTSRIVDRPPIEAHPPAVSLNTKSLALPFSRKEEETKTHSPLPLNPQIDPPPLRRRSSRTLHPGLLPPFPLLSLSRLPLPLLLIGTPTVVELANVTTVEQLLLQTLIDLVVDMARPRRGGGAGGYLGRELGQDGAEVGSAFAAAKRRGLAFCVGCIGGVPI